jgi:hypothetical protein
MAYSIEIDEIKDVQVTAQLAVYIRCVNED